MTRFLIWTSLNFILINYFILVHAEWPECGNFASAKGYPAGCTSTRDDFCVIQNEQCRVHFCDKELDFKNKFRQCNEYCENSQGNIDGFECYCLPTSVNVCPSTTQSMGLLGNAGFGNSSFDDGIAFESGFQPLAVSHWGAQIIIPDINTVFVYCSYKKDSCGLNTSLCEREDCRPGECHNDDSCYILREVESTQSSSFSVPPLSAICSGKATGIETILEKEYLTQLLNEKLLNGGPTELFMWTSGMVPSGSTDAMWKDWDTPITLEVVPNLQNLIGKAQDYDRYFIAVIKKDDPFMSFFLEPGGEEPEVNYVICEDSLSDKETTSADFCDVTTSTNPLSEDTDTEYTMDFITTPIGEESTTLPPPTRSETTQVHNTDSTTTFTSNNMNHSTTYPNSELNSSTTRVTSHPNNCSDIKGSYLTFIPCTTTQHSVQTTTSYSSSFDTSGESTSSLTTKKVITTNSDEDTKTATINTNMSTFTSSGTSQLITDEGDGSSNSSSITPAPTNDNTKTTTRPPFLTLPWRSSTTNSPTFTSTTSAPTPSTTTLTPTQAPTTDTSTASIITTTELTETSESETITDEPTTKFSTTNSEFSTENTDSSESTNTESTFMVDTTEELETTESTLDPETCVIKCSQLDQYEELWECCPGDTCTEDCPLGSTSFGFAYWNCSGDFAPNFDTPVPDYNECHNGWVEDVTAQVDNNNITSQELLNNLDFNVVESAVFGHEMTNIVNLTNITMSLLFEEERENGTILINNAQDFNMILRRREYTAQNAFSIMDRLFAFKTQWDQLPEENRTSIGLQIQNVTSFLGFAVTTLPRQRCDVPSRQNCSSHFMLATGTSSIMETQFVFTRIIDPDNSTVVKFPVSRSGSFIEIRRSSLQQKSNTDNIQTVGNAIKNSRACYFFPPSRNAMKERDKQFNSEVLSLFALAHDGTPLELFDYEAIFITLVHQFNAMGPDDHVIHRKLHKGEAPTAIQGSERCVFWNPKLEPYGRWDTSGCRIVSHSRYQTVCACNHLSSFALLMDVHSYIDKNPVMSVLSMVCSVASIVCLLLTLFVLHFLKGIQGERTSISKHVCLCLLAGHFMSLTLLDQSVFHLSNELCITVGVILHYVFLAAFMWMGVEGHHLYRLVLKVFDSGHDLSRHYLIVAYGTPFIIVGITGIVALSTGEVAYGNDGLCWLSSPKYIWAFMGPVFVLTGANLLILILALRVAVSAGGQQKRSVADRVKIWIRGWFSLSALLGTTWLFGFIYMEWYYNFAYVFILLTGLQGVFIFLSKVVLNEQVKTAFKKNARKRAMLRRFYNLAHWKGRGSGSSMQQSWFMGGSSSSQLDLTSASSSTTYWDHTLVRRRSSANPDLFTDPESQQHPSQFVLAGNVAGQHTENNEGIKPSAAWQFFKRPKLCEDLRDEQPYSQGRPGQNQGGDLNQDRPLPEIPEEGDDWPVYDRCHNNKF